MYCSPLLLGIFKYIFKKTLKMQSAERPGSRKGKNWVNNLLGDIPSLTPYWITPKHQLSRDRPPQNWGGNGNKLRLKKSSS